MNRLIPAMLATLVLAGCGQTGPLYMPGDEQSSERYDPQGAYQSDARQQDDGQPGTAQQDAARQNDDAERATPSTSDEVRTGGADSEDQGSAVSVPKGDSSPETTTAGTVGGAASTGAPAAPAASGQGGT